MVSESIRVCVIGAGAAGLCALRHLARFKDKFVPVAYEQGESVGGTWIYTEDTGLDKHGNPIHSSMYRDMKTNLPKEVMAFPDFPFPEGHDSFLPHYDVLDYLQKYADNFDLNKYINFETKVKVIEPLADSPGQWTVQVEDIRTKKLSQSVFGAVIVCNGNYFLPHYAPLPGIDLFQGEAIHSHDYRNADRYRGKQVLVFGAGPSGLDIGLEIATVADHVHMCHNNPPIPSKLPNNVSQAPGIVKCTGGDTFQVKDGSEIKGNVLVYCTGYEQSFPFLSKECHVEVVTRQVRPLYKHLIHTEFPTMAFVGIPYSIVPFPFFNIQIEWFCKTLMGRPLPSREEMDADTQQEKEERMASGIPERHFHKMGGRQWAYHQDIATLGDIQKSYKAPVEQLYNLVHQRRQLSLTSYKKDRFMYDDETNGYVCRA